MVIQDTVKRDEAAMLFWQGYKVTEISTRLDVPYQTVDSWKRRDGWEKASIAERIKSSTDARLLQLILKKDKTEADLREMESLGKLLERTARIAKFEQSEKPSDLNPKLKNRGQSKTGKNHLTEEQVEKLIDDFETNLFDYQKGWFAALIHRIRNILKSRQIGATWYFAREAFVDAIKTGDNQIFLSASKAQAHVFKGYIIDWVKEVTGVELKGDPVPSATTRDEDRRPSFRRGARRSRTTRLPWSCRSVPPLASDRSGTSRRERLSG